VRLAALYLREISEGGGGSVGYWAGSWDSGISVFHLNSRVLTFCFNVTFLCNSVELMSMVGMCVLSTSLSGASLNELADLCSDLG